jgi:hypothetical protein
MLVQFTFFINPNPRGFEGINPTHGFVLKITTTIPPTLRGIVWRRVMVSL